MTRIYRDKLGRFSKPENAISYQDDWKELKPYKKEIEYKEERQYDEYEYFVGFDYDTPKLTSKGQTVFDIHGKHDFHTEFKIISPVKLNEHEIRQLILSKFIDYSNVLKEDGYEIKSEEITKSNERPSINVKMTEKITR